MKMSLVLLLIFLANNLFAQQKLLKEINRDTINLRGYVYDYKGKPVPYLTMESAQNDFTYNTFKAWGHTDTSGYFEIKGAKLNDTLTFKESTVYGAPVYYNKDSRYLVIYLPPDRIVDINSASPIQLIEKRRYAKITPHFIPKATKEEAFFQSVHKMPQFRLGNDQFLTFIKNNIRYPESAIKNNIEGTVEITFKVEKDGSLDEFKILRGIGYNCDKAVLNAFNRGFHWQPAIDNGRPVAMRATVSVQFKLTDK